MTTVLVLAIGAVSAYRIVQARRREEEMLANPGSLTSASDAVDGAEIPPDADADQVLDVAVEQTFPASDPISIDSAYRKRA